ncbi:MAG: hypothetical protein OHK0038_23520 [Flammeovirgaceae bacterium]
MTFEAPKNHYEIVNDLLKGKFILWNEVHFDTLIKEQDFYKAFFKQSFDYELVLKREFAYLLSKNTNEEFSKRFTVILSILCYEWNLQGKDIKDRIENGSFSVFEIQTLLENSTYNDIFKLIKLKEEGIEKFLKELDQRNIIKLDNSKETFEFTKAVDLFFEFAKEIAESKLASAEQ